MVRLRRRAGTRVEDRRGAGGGFGGGGFGGGGGRGLGLPVGGGIGGILVVLLVVFLGGNLGGGGGGGTAIDPGLDPFGQGTGAAPAGAPGVPDPDAELVDYMDRLDGSLQEFWAAEFAAAGQQYQPTTLVLFEGQTQTACGTGTEATGPFYCPADQQAYIDLDFFRELRSRFGAPGDFAQAYVIAHEYGHHVQNVLGVSSQVRQAQQSDPDAANELSVRLELQADCFAGVWAHAVNESEGAEGLDPGDVEEGLAAASAVGDDRIQQQAGVEVDRESWTHGSAEQRSTWFRRGFDGGDVNACDTFQGGL